MTYQLIHNDILKWAAGYTGPKFHSLLCDPPYHLTITKRFGKPGSAPAKHGKDGAFSRASKGFMGQAWDGGEIAFNPETWAAMGEHLHDGAFGMAFASSRGWHRLACAIEGLAGIPIQEVKSMADLLAAARDTKDWGVVEQVELWLRGYIKLEEAIKGAGFIIHPSIFGWCFLSGFPKATRIDHKVDEMLGESPKVVGRQRRDAGSKSAHAFEKSRELEFDITQPATPQPAAWQGYRYGLQAMKPALEPIILFQKPYTGRPIDCIVTTGAGALNIDSCRIGTNGKDKEKHLAEWDRQQSANQSHWDGLGVVDLSGYANDLGRWPANLLLDQAGAALLDRQSGEIQSHPPGNTYESPTTKSTYGQFNNRKLEGYNDSGGASRMFFQSDWRYEILEQLENADPLHYEPKVSTAERNAGLDDPNPHPTLKPISLTKYLSSLLLPPDAYAPRRILCPFSGAGSEMIGAILAGWDEVTGIEKTAEYIPIAEARLAWWSRWPEWGQRNVEKILASTLAKQDEWQLSLFEAAQ